MKHGGKLAILTILTVGAVLGSFGWLWQVSQGRKARAAWGTENAMAIRYGDRAELLWLTPMAHINPRARPLQLADVTVFAAGAREVSSARDLLYYRQALVDDYAFEWDEPPPDTAADWTYALEFKGESTTCTLAFDFSRNVVRLVETGRELRLERITAEKLAGFLEEQSGKE